MHIENHWLRYHWEEVLKWASLLAPVPRADVWPQAEVTGKPGHFDLTQRFGGLPALPSAQTNGRTRDLDEITTLCLHQMAVRFGTTRARRAYWARLARELSKDIQTLYGLDGGESLERFAIRRAVHERMCGLPYHYAALLNGDRLKINGPRLYTYHGGRANAHSVSLAVEGLYPGLESNRTSKHDDLDSFMIETIRGLLTLAMLECLQAGIKITRITAHRQYSANRVADPGQLIWSEIGRWASVEFGLKIDYQYKTASGLQICREWDPGGLVDFRGKKLVIAA